MLLLSLVLLAAGLALVLCGNTYFLLGLGILAVLVFGALAVHELLPFRFRISEQGLDLRTRGIKRPVAWHEIEALVLEQPPRKSDGKLPPPRLLLVPVTGSDLNEKLEHRNPADGRPARLLLETDKVTQSPDQIAAVLQQFAGGRFTDLGGRAPAKSATEDFTVVLRGYDPARVNELVHLAEGALASGDPQQREWAKMRLTQHGLVVVLRGYDRAQVDAALADLASRL